MGGKPTLFPLLMIHSLAVAALIFHKHLLKAFAEGRKAKAEATL